MLCDKATRKFMFDLDGTLIHSQPGILHCLHKTIAELGLPPRDDAFLRNLIGPPFQLGFPKYLGLSGEETNRAIAVYRKYSEGVRTDPAMIAPFPGVLSMLRRLHAAGLSMGIVTSKGATPAAAQLAEFGFLPYLSYICTADDQGNGEKTELLRATCAKLGSEGLVMIGDRFYDLDAAHACAVESVGVLYGYGGRAEVEGCRPDYMVSSVGELEALLLHMATTDETEKEAAL